MKENVKEIMRELENISNNNGYGVFQTAVYCYMRLGNIENLDNEDIEEINNSIDNLSTIFNEDLNDFVDINIL